MFILTLQNGKNMIYGISQKRKSVIYQATQIPKYSYMSLKKMRKYTVIFNGYETSMRIVLTHDKK